MRRSSSRAAAACRLALVGLGSALCLLGCSAHQRGAERSAFGTLGPADLARVDASRWSWVEAECSDGSLELGRVGLDRELTLSAGVDGKLTIIFETELATEACYASAEWSARPTRDPARWRFHPQSQLVLPVDSECGAVERNPLWGSLQIFGDSLEIVAERSAWCRGFDARFRYVRAEAQQLSPRQLLMRYAGAFNRRDALALSKLFAERGSLVEPFTKTDDGNYKRHEGRVAIRAFYESAFASARWLALRPTALIQGAAPEHWIAEWEYMDSHLGRPLRGRNLFTMAAGEIYETEIQLIDDPQPSHQRMDPGSASSQALAPRSSR